MSKVSKLVLGLVLLLAVSASAFDYKPKYTEAGDPVAGAPTAQVPNKVLAGGVRYVNGKSLLTFVSGIPITENLVAFESVNLGNDNTLSSGMAYLWHGGKASGGLIAGVDTDWSGQVFEDSPLAYLLGTAGVCAGYEVTETAFVCGFARWRTDFSETNEKDSGWEIGIGVGTGL